MKTHKFIAALVADDVAVVPHQSMLWRAAAVAVLAAATAFFLLLYPRPDFMQAIRTVRFDFKFVVTLSLAASAFVSLRHGVRPEMGEKPLKATLLIVPALLSVAVVLELITVPSAYWVARWFGQNWLYCMAFIPALSLRAACGAADRAAVWREHGAGQSGCFRRIAGGRNWRGILCRALPGRFATFCGELVHDRNWHCDGFGCSWRPALLALVARFGALKAHTAFYAKHEASLIGGMPSVEAAPCLLPVEFSALPR